jgi:thiamine pyrophosphate-dependent acetolactate synthase large subunit-like protein
MPVLVIGATGPLDATRRRPWIEWIHTACDQGAIVRNYTKWDDQPAAAAAVPHALIRGKWLAETVPQAPVCINLDAGMQEEALAAPVDIPDPARLAPSAVGGVGREGVTAAADLLRGARSPAILMGRVSRSPAAWAQRMGLAEGLGARVLTDLKVGAAFPTDHPLHAGAPGIYPTAAAMEALAAADVILSLDWVDLGGTLGRLSTEAPNAKIVQVSSDHTLHNGWSMDYQGLPTVDLLLPAHPDAVVPDLCAALDVAAPDSELIQEPVTAADMPAVGPEGLMVSHLAAGLRRALAGSRVSLSHLPLSWDGAYWPFRHPLDFLGSDGGAGIGGGPGIAIGAALALKDSGCLSVAVCGDGDFLMGSTALWTAVHYRLPVLIVVANNQSFYNDEVHQERVARMRGRPPENKWIGQRMTDPEIDLAALAQAQGARGFGPVRTPDELTAACAEAVAIVKAGGVAVLDVRVAPGYTPAFQTALKQ